MFQVEITIQQTKEDTKITIVQKQVPVKEVSTNSEDIYFGIIGDIRNGGTIFTFSLISTVLGSRILHTTE